MNGFNLLIEHQCPQCGAPAILKETDRFFSCEFCRAKSYLIQNNFFRYMLPNNATQDKELLFFPYWRFKGTLFSCLASGVKHRFMDMSHRAAESEYFPLSVGLRSQTLKLRFASTETKGRFLKPTLPVKKVMGIFQGRFNTLLRKPVLHQAYIGETLSLIYSPFYLDKKLFDAVLNEPVSPVLPDDFDVSLFQEDQSDFSIRFLPAICPECGWDLDSTRDSLVLFCKNCDSAWQPSTNGFKKINFARVPGLEGDDVIYMPFWRIKAKISGIDLASYADLVKIANLPVVVRKNWDKIEFYFWIPGFKIRPGEFLNLNRRITIAQPREKLAPGLPVSRLYPVTLPVKEAAESLKINLACFAKPQKIFLSKIDDINITAKKFLLVHIPFVEKHHELIQPAFKIAINKNHLALSGNL